ncbi:hypothetical protein [Streptomyces sp. NPDC051219]|uniref:hypothetical protein n=1 Tax=Streptomyces sp. NPDC051219 TaxID=3155283 RepID=UPI00343EA77E
MTTCDSPIPGRLCALQLRLHRVRARYKAPYGAPPWCAEPAAGRTAAARTYGTRRLRERVPRLSAAVPTHPHWAAVGRGRVVDARTELTHVRTAGAEAA